MKLFPYLMFNGNCEEALNFYADVLKGEITELKRFEGSPAEEMSSDKQKIMHATFKAGDITFMASDTGEEGGKEEGSGQVNFSLDTDSGEEQERVFNAFAEGGNVTMPLQDTFWGSRFGMVTDKYGMRWMLSYEKK